MSDTPRDGQSHLKFGDFTARVSTRGGKVSVVWLDEAGVPVDLSMPTDAPSRRPSARSITGEIGRLAGGQRESIEALYLRRLPLTYAAWREGYLDHAMNATFARLLIWTFGGVAISEDAAEQGRAAVYREGRLIGIDGRAIETPEPADPVRLWHPVNASVRDVLSWRDFLEALGITQPFKQTHREVYLLTDAERATGTYSNRFAAHFLDQRQFLALSKTRKWMRMRRGLDDDPTSGVRRTLPDWRMRAEFAVQSARNIGVPAAAQYVGTGHTAFFNRRGAVALDTVPPVIFSEIMRDIDLFIGVSSIGNDPTWRDSGRCGVDPAYWHNVAFGELGMMAGTRRTVLAALLPKFKIADRCSLDGRYLMVRGNLLRYKIHIGSSNVLTDPGGQYLCIVPAQVDDVGKLFLPFEGDPTLSAIISKAFLLAEDDKIRDDIILNQMLQGM